MPVAKSSIPKWGPTAAAPITFERNLERSPSSEGNQREQLVVRRGNGLRRAVHGAAFKRELNYCTSRIYQRPVNNRPEKQRSPPEGLNFAFKSALRPQFRLHSHPEIDGVGAIAAFKGDERFWR
ncbi:unnamed protein product, partial [Iphiclides podalirius]